jgi:uncharacterized protein (DUF427 family)
MAKPAVIAQSDTYDLVEGTPIYLDIAVNGDVNRNAAWYYSDPKPEAQKIRVHVGFWNGVHVVR